MTHSIAMIVAPTGARKTKQHHAALPVSVSEIRAEAVACRDAGAAMIHLHARDPQGAHSLTINDNQAVYQQVKQAVGDSMIVQLTTEAVGQYTPEQQMALIRAVRPEAASFALKELIPTQEHIPQASDFFHWVASQNILSQYILYSPPELAEYVRLVQNGLLPEQKHHLLLVLGRYHQNQQSEPQDLLPFFSPYFSQLKCRWAVCAFGSQEAQCLTAGALLGGDVRVGFENNHLTLSGQPAISNAEQVASMRQILHSLNIQTLDAEGLRQQLVS
ncbi:MULTISPECIES: 3-keto-5-aminohexanoate cleavage protein [unclassified Vibrio]|uniref:3-keto-5-aminohexanoate cleavage protein n=1 Tax=unclassified Vibrio TaxID=2614977 RepID=UPI001361D595|nr:MULTISPECIES: 3-keto-5-aminohexanoate cleavage protein [unclassified Vibrio]NAW58575.1 3-keto-5-aminohexanoate cleavage protein [Vibrio sp. V36_P2S2PM302]NAX27459.1 3-keto-5-aminohexanoate cleavage protein [Vibrio sp. V38_P2S17PM301]NAX29974.1 3-keto-5-aminohexanoate cleavage protein [Vibrio sp. V37_P2S8PM304]